MKKRKVKIIIAIILVTLIIVGLVMLKKPNNDKKEEENTIGEKYVNLLPDGTKINTSNKVNKTRIIDGIEISEIQLTHKNGVSVLLATATNISGVDKDTTVIEITLYDDKNNILEKVEGIIEPIKSGESVQLNMGISADYSNAYDFKVKGK